MPRWSGSRTTSGPRRRSWPWRTPWSPRSGGSRSSCEPRDRRTQPDGPRTARCRGGGRVRGGRGSPAPRDRCGIRGDGRAVPHQRALRTVRGSVRGRGHPLSGARRFVPAAAGPSIGTGEAAQRFVPGRRRGGGGGDRRGGLRCERPTGRHRGGHTPGGPRSAPGARGRVPRCHRWRGRRRLRRGAHRAVLHAAERARREPADVPSLQGVGVGRGVPAPAARQGTALPDAPLERRSRRRTPAVLRRHHPGAPAPVPVLAAGGSIGSRARSWRRSGSPSRNLPLRSAPRERRYR